MNQKVRNLIFGVTFALLGALSVQASVIQFSITNDAPANGLWIMRPWIGINDGGFVTYTVGQPATTGVTHQAEDGVTGDPANALAPSNACTGIGYSSDCLFQTFGAYSGSYSQISIGNPTAPGATISGQLAVDPNNPNSQYLSYLVMAIPSNDAFFGTSTGNAIQLFDSLGQFNGGAGDIVISIFSSSLLDAGTEANNACAGGVNDTAFLCQSVNGTGLDGEGTVQPHGMFAANIVNGSNGFGGTTNTFTAINDSFINGTKIATITISEVPEPASFTFIGIACGVLLFARKLRKTV